MSAGEDQHVPVLRDAILEQLNLQPDGTYVDGTFGRGGHSQAILDRLGPEGRLVVIDRDPQATAIADALAVLDARVTVVRGSFGDIEQITEAHGVLGKVDGIILDLGVSSPQLAWNIFRWIGRPGPCRGAKPSAFASPPRWVRASWARPTCSTNPPSGSTLGIIFG